jgi:hypothetical protein
MRNGGRVSAMALGVDDPRRVIQAAQGFGQKPLGRVGILRGRPKKIKGCAQGIHDPVHYGKCQKSFPKRAGFAGSSLHSQ